jgi:hypothetical protein
MASEETKAKTPPTKEPSQKTSDTSKGGSEAPKLWTPSDGCDIEVMVRGGTTSSKWDLEQAKIVAEAEARRKQLDEDRKLASIPVEQGGAMMFDRNFSDPLKAPKVLLRYHTSDMDLEILCELIVDDDKEDVILQFVCPQCVKRGMHPGEAQCTVRDSHRGWHLDMRDAGQIKYAETVDMAGRKIREPYVFAGVIKDTDTLRCSQYNCGRAYKIDNNILHDV